jgi:hypothetical protein
LIDHRKPNGEDRKSQIVHSHSISIDSRRSPAMDAVADNGSPSSHRPAQSRPAAADQAGADGVAADPQARCRHDLIRAQCWECRSRRAKLPGRVAVTSGGTVFHVAEDCQALHDGWRKTSRRGGSLSDLTWVPTGNALAEGRGSCVECCAHLDPT